MSMKNVLIVEDEIIIARDYQLMLESNGHHVVKIVNNGKDAIDQAIQHKPDVILMDINIKGDMNGIETATVIHNIQINPKIVFITAFDLRSFVLPDFEHYTLNKPIHKFNLLNILKICNTIS